MNEHNDGPMIVVGYSVPMQHGLDAFRPDDSVIFVDEPDVAVARGVETHLASSTSVRELISFAYHLPGAADAFYLVFDSASDEYVVQDSAGLTAPASDRELIVLVVAMRPSGRLVRESRSIASMRRAPFSDR